MIGCPHWPAVSSPARSAGSTTTILAAKRATSTIPIVFFGGGDPIVFFGATLAQPGGNLTGISVMASELIAR
jgi:putative ABC transport system substrate-binding protein